jgi:hypothetical protein
MTKLAFVGLLAIGFLVGFLSTGLENANAQFFAFYVAIPTEPDNNTVHLNQSWHGTGLKALDWDDPNPGVGFPVYARGWATNQARLQRRRQQVGPSTSQSVTAMLCTGISRT